jgi:hypothetical protein
MVGWSLPSMRLIHVAYSVNLQNIFHPGNVAVALATFTIYYAVLHELCNANKAGSCFCA